RACSFTSAKTQLCRRISRVETTSRSVASRLGPPPEKRRLRIRPRKVKLAGIIDVRYALARKKRCQPTRRTTYATVKPARGQAAAVIMTDVIRYTRAR